MALQITLPAISVGAKRMASIDLTKDLDDSELATGTPTVVEVGTAALSLANKAVNSAEIEIKGKAVAIGKAVQFTVDAASAVKGVTYMLLLTVGTNSDPAERLVYDVALPCV